LAHWRIFKPSVETSIPSGPFQKMQSFEPPNGFFPLNAYFYPDAGFAPVASSSIPEPVFFPSEIDFNGVNDGAPGFPQQHFPSPYYHNKFLPLQSFSMVGPAASSSIPDGTSGIPQQHYPSAYYPYNFLPFHGFSMDSYTAYPEKVASTSLSDDSKGDHPSAIPATKPPVRKTRVQNRKRLGEEGRIEFLQNDEYILSFRETRVTCAGCRKKIRLDSRNGARYYPGFWLKHKDRCSGVEAKMVRILSGKFCVFNLTRVIDCCKAQRERRGRKRDVIFWVVYSITFGKRHIQIDLSIKRT